MNLFSKIVMAFAIVVLLGFDAYSADLLKPKREMRTVWLATAWRIDWPTEYDKNNNPITGKENVITVTGDVTQINAQKKHMINMLDSLKKNNMNCVNFQVRSRSDALYKSAFEPWSSEIVAKRGMDPGYDPLQFVIDECHKRGMECHAWINPYRYESTIGAWNGLPGNYRKDHPDWLMDFNGVSILNPGKPEVTQRIVDICKDIITKYDVDGILYDDYFYIPESSDKDGNKKSYALDLDLYEGYLAEGGKLSQGDWRRENVNTMIKAVYNMIQEVKPWVRFGVSPAGVAATNPKVASKYGVTPSSGNDWQYDDIHSDPLAWISSHSLDYISPQVYWTIGYATADYGKITPWWSMVADKFKRHLYVSHSITSLNYNSKGDIDVKGMSNLERSISAYQPKASGPNNTTFKEFADQIRLNRESSLDDAPGSFFYSAKFMACNIAPLFSHYLGKTVFTKRAILPAMSYKPGYNPGKVKNMGIKDGKLSWDGYDNVRYTVYAVPNAVAQKDFNFEVDYLLDTSYDTSYNIPEEYRSGYQFAVCVLDRMGHEYTPVFLGAEMKTLAAPTLNAPGDGLTVDDPFDFEWSAVDGAKNYIIEIAYDSEFKNMFRTYPVNGVKLSSTNIEGLKSDVKLYWRVRSTGINSEDGVSSYLSVIPKILEVLSPVDDSNTGVTPFIEWNMDRGLVEISTDAGFKDGTIVHTAESNSGSYQVPDFVLKSSTKYYVRVTVESMGLMRTCKPVGFVTGFIQTTLPEIMYPKDGGKFYSEDMITVARQTGAHTFNIEVAGSDDFPSRVKYQEVFYDFNYKSKKGGDINIGGKKMVEGNTYYLRAEATGIDEDGNVFKTGKCNVISFVYSGQGSGVEDNISGIGVYIKGVTEPILSISAPVSARIEAKAYNSVGVLEDALYDGESDGTIEIPLSHLQNGMHIIVVKINGTVKTLKMIR